MTEEVTYRVRPDLLISFRDGEPGAERPVAGARDDVSRDVLAFLAAFRDGMTVRQLRKELVSRGLNLSEEGTEALLMGAAEDGLLAWGPEDEDEATVRRLLADDTWGDKWGPEAWRFHQATRYGPYQPEQLNETADDLDGTVVVPLLKRYVGVPTVPLPGPADLPDVPFARVLHERRTIREFAREPLDAVRVSQLLFHVQFPHQLVDAPPYGWVPLRTYPNGGARGELDVYVLVRRVEGIPAGVYHYQCDGHHLERLGGDPGDQALCNLAYGQEMAVTAPFTVILTAAGGRAAAKYLLSRALRVIYFDGGCFTAVFTLTARALGLGAYITAAYCDGDVETLLGLDGVKETPLLLLGAGIPAREPLYQPRIMRCSPDSPLPAELIEDV